METETEQELLERKNAELLRKRAELDIHGTDPKPSESANGVHAAARVVGPVLAEIHERARRMAAMPPRALSLVKSQQPLSRAACNAMMRRGGVYPEHLDADVADFPGREEVLLSFVRAGDPFGIMVTGDWGTGKTRLLCALYREAILGGLRTIYVRAQWFFDRVFSTYGEFSRESTAAAINDYSGCPLLLLDDLGHEGKPSDAKTSLLHEVISHRNGHRKLTAVSTNLTIAEIENRYDGSIADRMQAWMPIALIGESRRLSNE